MFVSNLQDHAEICKDLTTYGEIYAINDNQLAQHCH